MCLLVQVQPAAGRPPAAAASGPLRHGAWTASSSSSFRRDSKATMATARWSVLCHTDRTAASLLCRPAGGQTGGKKTMTPVVATGGSQKLQKFAKIAKKNNNKQTEAKDWRATPLAVCAGGSPTVASFVSLVLRVARRPTRQGFGSAVPSQQLQTTRRPQGGVPSRRVTGTGQMWGFPLTLFFRVLHAPPVVTPLLFPAPLSSASSSASPRPLLSSAFIHGVGTPASQGTQDRQRARSATNTRQ
jgi:hypothetical protein